MRSSMIRSSHLLPVHPLLQHCVVEADSEMLCYLRIKKTNNKCHFFTYAGSAILSQNLPSMVPVSYTINSFRSGHFVSVRLTGYSEDLI